MSNESQDDKLERLLSDWGAARNGKSGSACLTMTQAAALAAEDSQAPQELLEHSRSCPRCARLVGRLESSDPQPAAAAHTRNAWAWAPWALAACLAVTSGLLILASTMIRSQRQALLDSHVATAQLTGELLQVQKDAHLSSARAIQAAVRDSQQLDDLARRIAQAERSAAQQVVLADEVELLRQRLGQVQQAQVRREAAVDATWRMLVGNVPVTDPSPAAVAAMQSAARSADLAGRVAALEADSPDEATRHLLGRLEAVLLRLEIANPDSQADRQWVAQQAQAGLIDGIDAIIGENPAASGPAKTAFFGGSEELKLLLAQSRAILLRGLCAG